ncbi:MAG: 2-C-methyl-D-erythritol 2,4-cyclodiphosphate synthase [Candidatus Omnitrophota bacterium]
MYRIGIGYDIHRLVKGRKLILGGIEIAFPRGLLGHSDADVLIHAVCDALLGACAAGDIGEHFPNNDSAYKDISSMELLKKVDSILKEAQYEIDNIDAVIIAEKPHLSDLKSKIAENISRVLGILSAQVSVKATTNEGVGVLGRGQAIAVYAVALLKKRG